MEGIAEMKKTSTGFVTIDVKGTEVRLKDDDRIAQHILNGKVFEPQTLDFFHDQVQQNTDRMFLDIGCYSGLFSILATKMGMQSIGFEPFPPNRNQILWNMQLNGVEFILSPLALSDRNGKARFGHTDVHLTSGGSLERKGSNGIEVKTARLDTFYDGRRNIGIVKMDVERHEPAVLRGAKYFITTHRPVMIIEANDQEMVNAVNKEMEGLNYAPAFVLDVRNLVFMPR
jgi:FkbM family methyltransferase